MNSIDFSVVVPVYNSQDSLRELYERLDATFAAMECSFEVIFVNDGSTDGSLAILTDLHRSTGNVRVVDLFKNHGQQSALMSGFQYCTGDVVVTMDDDLQHSPEDIPVMYERLLEGYDAIFGSFEIKQNRIDANIGSAMIRSVNHHLFDPPPGLRMSAFRLIKSEVVDVIKHVRTPFPYITGMILSTTNRITNVTVRHDERRYGSSGYSFRSRARLSRNLLINYSALPLRLMGYFGLLASAIGLITGGFFMARQIMVGQAPAGWTTLIVLVSFFSAVMFVMLFVIGEYLSRILRELRDDRSYAIRQELM
ncbi:MAG: glycosyltransferase [Actinomycetota bacterium]|nr:glycosyltransferase [Actinomycetota bacterium]